jgi:hypothetical protein
MRSGCPGDMGYTYDGLYMADMARDTWYMATRTGTYNESTVLGQVSGFAIPYSVDLLGYYLE